MQQKHLCIYCGGHCQFMGYEEINTDLLKMKCENEECGEFSIHPADQKLAKEIWPQTEV